MTAHSPDQEERGLESIADVLKRIQFDRLSLEEYLTEPFDKTLSLQLDAALLAEESGRAQQINDQELTA